MKMKNHDLENFLDEFDDEKENGFFESVYEKFYAYLADSFCKVSIFGVERVLDADTLYACDRHLAVELWNDCVSQSLKSFESFCGWVSEVVQDDLEGFFVEFQRWLLSRRNDEQASNAIVAIMAGDIDLTSVVEWLYGRLRCDRWEYPRKGRSQLKGENK